MHNDPIIVVGGGFAGLTTVLALSNQRPRPPLLLIEPRNQFIFLPLLYELLSGEMKTWEVAPSYDSLLQGRRIPHLDDRVISIDTSQRSLKTSRGQTISYSQLVLATGSEPDDFGIPGVKEHAMKFHSLADLPPLKDCIHSLRNQAQEGALVIVGAGATGVELACKLSDMLERAATIHLVELGDSILPRSKAFNREQAQRALVQRGVKRHLNTRVSSVSASSVQLICDDLPISLNYEGLIWTAGTKPVLPTLSPTPTFQRGLLNVDEGLRLTTDPNVVALGDVASHNDADSPWPRSAQSALQQGASAARTIQAIRMEQAIPDFHFQDLGEMLSLGIGDASITGMGLTLAGPLAYRLRRLTYLARMPGLSLGLRSACAWLVDS
ncbi:MAG: 3-hydroxyacyl-CoA dehydrogenase [Propionibacteriaceae bacterium]|nr:3-hydroxyacyl-CoA dehydrogenase [Propionibacteriaceae bacterium]